MEALVADNANRCQDQVEYQRRYADLNARYDAVKKRLDDVTAERQSRASQKEEILRFIDTVRQRDALLTGFDENLWRATVDSVTVHSLTDIRVKFRDGREIKINIK